MKRDTIVVGLVGRPGLVDAGDNRKTMDQSEGVCVRWTIRRFRRRFAEIGTIFKERRKTRNASISRNRTVGRRYRTAVRRALAYVVTTTPIRSYRKRR